MSTARYLELPHELQERIRCDCCWGTGGPAAHPFFCPAGARRWNPGGGSLTIPLPASVSSVPHDSFYYEHMMGTSHPGDDGMHELAKLPKKLYEDIVTALHGQALDAVPLLRGLEPTFIAELAQRVTSHILLPDEAVFKEGDISREMVRSAGASWVTAGAVSLRPCAIVFCPDVAPAVTACPPRPSHRVVPQYFITHGVLVVGEAGAGHAASKIDGGVVSEIRAGSFFGELALLTVRCGERQPPCPPRPRLMRRNLARLCLKPALGCFNPPPLQLASPIQFSIPPPYRRPAGHPPQLHRARAHRLRYQHPDPRLAG